MGGWRIAWNMGLSVLVLARLLPTRSRAYFAKGKNAMGTPDLVVNPSAPRNLVDQLCRDEGFNPLPYKDSRGVLTIGYGINIEDGGLNEDEARLVLSYRASAVRWNLVTTLPWVGRLDAVRQDVLVNMAYNLGLHGLLKFRKMLAHAAEGQWQEAADEMLNSDWEKQVHARAHRLAVQMVTGVRQ